MTARSNMMRLFRAYCSQQIEIKDSRITRQESARKMWGLRTGRASVHEDWKGSWVAPKHCLSTPGFIIKIKDNIIFIN